MRGLILKFIEDHKTVKRRELLIHLHSMGVHTTDRIMRLEICSMINEDGHPIASTESGYKLIRTQDDLEKAISYLKKKAYPLFDRANSLYKNFNKDKTGQLTFENFLN